MCAQTYDYPVRTSTARKGRRNVLAILRTLALTDVCHNRADQSHQYLYLHRYYPLPEVRSYNKVTTGTPYFGDLGIP